MVPIEGVDYSTARPSPSGLRAAGKRFVVRYGGPGSAPKHLTASELTKLKAAGLDVVANAEGAAAGFRGAVAGRSWAASAQAAFRALGMPANRPIYFSVDWDAGSKDWPSIDAALRAAADVIGVANVGVYGSYNTIAHCVSAGTARWFWQTYAWSHNRLHGKANLYQWRNGVKVAGGDCDLTRALTVDYGQWGYRRGQVADATPGSKGDDVSRQDAKLGVYDALAEAAIAANGDPNDGDTPTGRQLRDNFNTLVDARLDIKLAPLLDRLDRIIAAQARDAT